MCQKQRIKLNQADIHSIDDLAALPKGSKIQGLSSKALKDLREQAKLQVAPKGADGNLISSLRKSKTLKD